MRVTVNHILAAAQEISETTIEEIISTDRHRYIVRVRQACYYLALQQGYSRNDIGRRIGGRDRSSVRHGIKKCDITMSRDPGYSALVYAIGARAFERSDREFAIYRDLGARLDAAAA